jgi:uncharacterized protein (DUF3084 family)
MLKQDSMIELAGSFKEVIALMSNPGKVDQFVTGIVEAKAIIAEKNKVLDAKEEVDAFNKAKQATVEAMDLRQATLNQWDKDLAAREAAALSKEAQNIAASSALASDRKAFDDQKTALAARESAIASKDEVVSKLNADLNAALAETAKAKELYLAKLNALTLAEETPNASA